MASLLTKLQAGMYAGLKAFREGYLSADMDRDPSDQLAFGAWDARRLRYAVHWAFYENTAYRDVHTWAKKMRADYGLYRHIRGIYNPAFRLGEFYATHLLGGALDRHAGDGQATPSAIPILTDDDRLRLAIATLWRDSNWQIQKDIWTRTGAVLGDTAIYVTDDVARQKVYLEPLHPSRIKYLLADAWGNVKAYTIEEQRVDPAGKLASVTYTETAQRDGDYVVYATYRNGAPYAWNGDAATWDEPYGFIPVVLTQHLNVGLGWGFSEYHAGHGKFSEADDIASKLNDQIRKTVDSPWLFAGVDNPNARGGDGPRVQGKPPTPQQPEPGRQEIPAIYAKEATARAYPLVAPLAIGEVSTHIGTILAEIERDYPELQSDIYTASGDASGRALRVARQRVSTKVQMRRANYDDGLVRAQQMAVAIGGYRGYPGYESFNLDSYAAGLLDHQIGDRPVFEADPQDKTDEETAFWTAAKAAKDAGLPLDVYLKRQGWSDEQIVELNDSPERQARNALMQSGMNGLNGRGGTNGE